MVITRPCGGTPSTPENSSPSAGVGTCSGEKGVPPVSPLSWNILHKSSCGLSFVSSVSRLRPPARTNIPLVPAKAGPSFRRRALLSRCAVQCHLFAEDYVAIIWSGSRPDAVGPQTHVGSRDREGEPRSDDRPGDGGNRLIPAHAHMLPVDAEGTLVSRKVAMFFDVEHEPLFAKRTTPLITLRCRGCGQGKAGGSGQQRRAEHENQRSISLVHSTRAMRP